MVPLQLLLQAYIWLLGCFELVSNAAFLVFQPLLKKIIYTLYVQVKKALKIHVIHKKLLTEKQSYVLISPFYNDQGKSFKPLLTTKGALWLILCTPILLKAELYSKLFLTDNFLVTFEKIIPSSPWTRFQNLSPRTLTRGQLTHYIFA